MTTLSAAILLFLVMDPIGNTPVFLTLLAPLGRERAKRVIVRELSIALGILVVFLFAGQYLLDILQLTEPALGISGGIILFLIALKMIFADVNDLFGGIPEGEPFVVPLAIPLLAGPSAIATVLLLMSRQPENWPNWLLAILCSGLASGVILYFATSLGPLLGKRGIVAIQRLFGMLLTTVAVQMFLTGIRQFIALG